MVLFLNHFHIAIRFQEENILYRNLENGSHKMRKRGMCYVLYSYTEKR